MYFSAIRNVRIWPALMGFGLLFRFAALGQEAGLSSRDRDEIGSRAITLVSDFEKLLNVIATKGTTASDVQDLIQQTTAEEGRLFFDNKVNVEDDLYSLNADSLAAKDVSIVKYINDWDLFYIKTYSEGVVFSDLRLSEITRKEYTYLKVYFVAQFRNRHKDFDRPYPDRRRIALIRVDRKDDKWELAINGISFFRSVKPSGVAYTPEAFEEDFKPFVKENKVRLVRTSGESDSLLASQVSLQRRSDSLYAEAVKAQIQLGEDQKKKEEAYSRAIARADSLFSARAFSVSLEAYTEARSFKPFELYPRTRINELARILESGSADPAEVALRQESEGDRLFKIRDYEGARQNYLSALNLTPDNSRIKEKIARVDVVLRNKSEIRARYMAGNYRAALKEYGRVIAADKANPDYYFERGRCYQAMGETKKALQDFDKALELDRNFQEALVARSQLYQKSGQTGPALSDYTTLIAIDPSNHEYLYRRGILHLAGNDLESALPDFEAALKLNPKDIQSLVMLAETFRRKGKPDMALETADQAIGLNPGYPGGHFQKGMALMEKNQDEKAAQALGKAVRLGVNEEQDKALGQLYDRFFKGAKEQEARTDYTAALGMVRRAIVVRPRSAEAYYFMALQQEKLGKPAEAVQALNQAVFLKEDMAEAYLKKGQILLANQEVAQAPDAFRRALRYDRRNLNAAMGLGDAFTALGRLDSAMVWYGEALAIRPGSADALIKRGKAHFIKENYVRALMDFEDALRADKRMAEAHFYRGRINKALRQYEKAIDNFGEALDLGYSRYECAVEVGASYALLNNHSKAIKYFNAAVKEEPNKGKAYGLRGLSHLAEENYREALADLDEALKADTSMGNTANRLELGFLKLRFNDYKGAEEQFGKALDREPYNARGNYGLAVSQYLLGKTELAMRTFEQAFIPRRLEYDRIRKDPWMKSILKDKAFKKLLKAYFDK